MSAETLQASSPLSEAEYQGVLARVRDCATRTIPPGGRVLVVSKGDELLLQLGPCLAAHFPQEPDGRYSGYYPLDSTAATEHLEALRDRGAEYLLFPSTAMWWLDHYADFGQHLQSRYRLLANEPGTCVIFSLGSETPRERGPARDLLAARHDQEVRQLRELLHSLLPDDAIIAVVAAGDPALLDLGFADAHEFPAAGAGNLSAPVAAAGLFRDLQDLAASGADYLVVPALVYPFLDDYRAIVAQLEADCQSIASQRYLGSVFSLKPLKVGSWPS